MLQKFVKIYVTLRATVSITHKKHNSEKKIEKKKKLESCVVSVYPLRLSILAADNALTCTFNHWNSKKLHKIKHISRQTKEYVYVCMIDKETKERKIEITEMQLKVNTYDFQKNQLSFGCPLLYLSLSHIVSPPLFYKIK